MANTIKTYSNESFRTNYLQPESDGKTLHKTDYERFFVLRLEEVIPLMKLPVPPTRSTNHILVYLTAGEVSVSVGSDSYKIGQNECLLVPSGQAFAVDQADGSQGYLCNFHHDFLTGRLGKAELLQDYEFLKVWGNPCIRLDEQTATYIAQIMGRMLLHATTQTARRSLLQITFLTLLSEINLAYQPVSTSSQTHAVLITNRFKELVFAHSRTHHLVAQYADLLHITPNHLNKSVRLITGKSPIKWIDEAIILEAKVLLYQTKLSVGEVAAQVGILDPSYFSRLFKKQAGTTPLGFRKMIEIA